LLDKTFALLDLVCWSPLSQSANKLAVNQVRIDFVDECYNASITPAVMNSFGGNLYTTIKKSITSLASINMAGCPDIFYMLDGPNFNAAATAPGFTPA